MTAKITWNWRGYGRNVEYVRGSPAQVGVKIGDILTQERPPSHLRDSYIDCVEVEILPPVEEL